MSRPLPTSQPDFTFLRPLAYPLRLEDSPRGLGRTLGKRVGGNPSRVRISYPPPLPRSRETAGQSVVSGSTGMSKEEGRSHPRLAFFSFRVSTRVSTTHSSRLELPGRSVLWPVLIGRRRHNSADRRWRHSHGWCRIGPTVWPAPRIYRSRSSRPQPSPNYLTRIGIQHALAAERACVRENRHHGHGLPLYADDDVRDPAPSFVRHDWLRDEPFSRAPRDVRRSCDGE